MESGCVTSNSHPKNPPPTRWRPIDRLIPEMINPSETGLPPVHEGEKLLTKKELAKYLRKSERTIDNWRKHLDLPCLKIRHSVFFRLSEVIPHLEKHNGRT
jgi:hypothetical protein